MAIIDSQLVFFDQAITTTTTSSIVPLTSLRLPGRMEPIPIRINITEGFSGTEISSCTFTLQEADSPTGSWTNVPAASFTIQGSDMSASSRHGWRFLPASTRKSFLRLICTVSPQSGQSITKGKIFAALMKEEDFPYEAALTVK